MKGGFIASFFIVIFIVLPYCFVGLGEDKMDTQKYILSREGYGKRGLQSLCEETGVKLSAVEEFGRRALTINLTDAEVEKLKSYDEAAQIHIYEGLKLI